MCGVCVAVHLHWVALGSFEHDMYVQTYRIGEDLNPSFVFVEALGRGHFYTVLTST